MKLKYSDRVEVGCPATKKQGKHLADHPCGTSPLIALQLQRWETESRDTINSKTVRWAGSGCTNGFMNCTGLLSQDCVTLFILFHGDHLYYCCAAQHSTHSSIARYTVQNSIDCEPDFEPTTHFYPSV